MGKHEVGIFRGVYKDHEIKCTMNGGEITFSTEGLTEKTRVGEYPFRSQYTTYQAICDALDRMELSARKDFKNGEAFRVLGRYQRLSEVEAVTVTSLPDEQTAWIRTANGERQKVSRSSLYASRAACNAYVKALAHEEHRHRKVCEDLQVALNGSLWQPKSE